MKTRFLGISTATSMLIIILLLSSSVLADKIADANGTLTVNNNNGQFDATISNTLSVTFETATSSSGGGGGGGGGFDKTNYSRNTTAQNTGISNLQELLNTVTGIELGNPVLTTAKMKAELKNTFLLTSKLDSNALRSWQQLLPDEKAKEYLMTVISKMESGELFSLGAEHKSEIFVVKTSYANNPAYANRTRVTITITAPEMISNVIIIEMIPKSIANSVSELIFVGENPRIVASDPLLEWKIPSMNAGETKTLTYYVKSYVKSDDFKTSVSYEKPETETPTGNVVNTPLSEPAANEEPEQKNQNDRSGTVKRGASFILPLIIIVLAAGLLVGASVVLSKKKNAQAMLASSQSETSPGQRNLMIRQDLVIPYEKVKSVEIFIEGRVRQGESDAEIRKELISSGWDEHAVDVVLHDVHAVDNNLDKLDSFVQTCVDKGLTLDTVKQTLMNVGWREDIVDLVLEDFKA